MKQLPPIMTKEEFERWKAEQTPPVMTQEEFERWKASRQPVVMTAEEFEKWKKERESQEQATTTQPDFMTKLKESAKPGGLLKAIMGLDLSNIHLTKPIQPPPMPQLGQPGQAPFTLTPEQLEYAKYQRTRELMKTKEGREQLFSELKQSLKEQQRKTIIEQAVEGASDFVKAVKTPEGRKELLNRFMAGPKALGSGILLGEKQFYDLLSWALEEAVKTDIPHRVILGKLAEWLKNQTQFMVPTAQKWLSEAEASGLPKVEEVALRKLGEMALPGTLMALTGLPGAVAYMGLSGLKEGGLVGGLAGAAQGLAMGGIGKALGSIPRWQAIPAGATSFGMAEYTRQILTGEKYKPEEVWSEAILGGMFGGIGGKPAAERRPVTFPDFVKRSRIFSKLYQDVWNKYASIEGIADIFNQYDVYLYPEKNPLLLIRSKLGEPAKLKAMANWGVYKFDPQKRAYVKMSDGMVEVLADAMKATNIKDPLVMRQILSDLGIARRTVTDLAKPRLKIPKEIMETIDPEFHRFFGEEIKLASEQQIEAAYKTLEKYRKELGQQNFDYLMNVSLPRITKFFHSLLDLSRERGLISKELYDACINLHPNYVPFYREYPQFLKQPKGAIFSKRYEMKMKGEALPKKMEGSDLPVQDIFLSGLEQARQILDAAERNWIKKTIYDLAVDFGDRIPELRKSVSVTGPKPGVLNEIVFRDNGERNSMFVSDQLYDAIMNMDTFQTNTLSKFLAPARTAARILKYGATVTPEFAIKNFFRDQFSAYVQNRVGFRPFVETAAALADILKKNDIYIEWMRSGAPFSGLRMADEANLRKLLKEELGTPSAVKKMNILKGMEGFSEILEQATRLAIYKKAKAAGLHPLEAALASAEATVDFRVRGGAPAMENFNQIVAFLNANVQGLDKFRRAMVEDPFGTFAKAFYSITLPSIIFYILNYDDEEWQEWPQWQKDIFWGVRIGGRLYRIPKPIGIGYVFGSMPERFLEYARTKDPTVMKQLAEGLFDAASPVAGDPITGLLPTAIKPALEVMTNSNFWSVYLLNKKPLIPEGVKDLIPELQRTPWTSETSKLIAEKLGKSDIGRKFLISPIYMDHLIKGYFGTLGRWGLAGTDALIELVRSKGSVKSEGMFSKKRIKELSDIPIVGAFVPAPLYRLQSDSLETFWEHYNEMRPWLLSAEKLIEENIDNPQVAINELMKNNRLMIARMMTDLAERIRKQRKAMETISAMNIPDDQKRKLLTEEAKKIIDLAKKGNELYNLLKEVK